MAIEAAQRRTALLVAGCFFLENLDATIVTTAAPAIGRSLRVPATAVGLVVTAYLLSLAVLIPVSGWMATRFGPRRVFAAAIIVFTLASAGCAASDSLTVLVALRVVQGVGGAMMVPVGRLVVLARAEPGDLMRVIAWLTWPALVAPIIAPLAGGLLVTYVSWRAIFLINVPLGAIALLAALRFVHDGPRTDPAPLDRAGVLLSGAALGGLAWSAHLLADAPLGLPVVLWLAASAALGVAAVRHLRATPHPLVDLAVLRVVTLRTAVSGSSLFWLVVGAVPFLLPLLFQEVFGWSPVRSGAVVLFVFVGNLGIKPATSPLMRRFGFRRVLVAACVGVSASVIALGLVRATTPLAVIAALCVISGALRSTGFSAFNTLGLSDISPPDIGSANVLVVTGQQLSAAFAISTATLGLRIGEVVARSGAGAGAGGWLAAGAARVPYALTFWLLAVVALLAAVVVGRLPAGAGDAVRRGSPAPEAAPS